MLGLQNEREWVNFCDKVLLQRMYLAKFPAAFAAQGVGTIEAGTVEKDLKRQGAAAQGCDPGLQGVDRVVGDQRGDQTAADGGQDPVPHPDLGPPPDVGHPDERPDAGVDEVEAAFAENRCRVIHIGLDVRDLGTGVGGGLAMPHAPVEGLPEPFGLLAAAIAFSALLALSLSPMLASKLLRSPNPLRASCSNCGLAASNWRA